MEMATAQRRYRQQRRARRRQWRVPVATSQLLAVQNVQTAEPSTQTVAGECARLVFDFRILKKHLCPSLYLRKKRQHLPGRATYSSIYTPNLTSGKD